MGFSKSTPVSWNAYMPLKKNDKLKIKQSIVSALEELTEQLELTEASSKTVELDQALAGRVSRIDAIQQQKIAEAGKMRAAQKTRKLELALTKLEEDEFGYCEECGEDILFERLMIKPDSLYCVECQSLKE